jgi:DivIVA domain-containing protein
VGTVLGYILALLVVGGVLFLAASYAFGRGEEMAPALPEGTPLELPDDRLAGGDDLRALKLSVALRGYRMDEVDWLLERLAEQVDTRDREIDRLRSVLHVEPVDVPAEPELLTHPVPRIVDAPDNGWSAGTDNDWSTGTDHGRSAGTDNGRAPGIAEGRVSEAGDEAASGSGGDQRADGRRPYPVPEGTGDTGARPDRPARDIRTAPPPEPE